MRGSTLEIIFILYIIISKACANPINIKEVQNDFHTFGGSIDVVGYNENHEMYINADPLDEILSHPEVKDRKIAVVCIEGGDGIMSHNMDHALRILYANFKSIAQIDGTLFKNFDWISDSTEPSIISSLEIYASENTSVVDLWSDVFLYEFIDEKSQENEKVALILMEIKKLADLDTYLKILELLSKTCSIQISNLNEKVPENDFERFEILKPENLVKKIIDDTEVTGIEYLKYLKANLYNWKTEQYILYQNVQIEDQSTHHDMLTETATNVQNEEYETSTIDKTTYDRIEVATNIQNEEYETSTINSEYTTTGIDETTNVLEDTDVIEIEIEIDTINLEKENERKIREEAIKTTEKVFEIHHEFTDRMSAALNEIINHRQLFDQNTEKRSDSSEEDHDNQQIFEPQTKLVQELFDRLLIDKVEVEKLKFKSIEVIQKEADAIRIATSTPSAEMETIMSRMLQSYVKEFEDWKFQISSEIEHLQQQYKKINPLYMMTQGIFDKFIYDWNEESVEGL